jgi:YD repeat-containing protein
MTPPISRRGFFAGLFGTVGAAATSAELTPPHCRHYYDGVLWCQGDPHRTSCFVRDEAGCLFCHAEEAAKRYRVTPPPVGCRTTFVYDPRPLPMLAPTFVTTYTYDPNGRLLSVTVPVRTTTCT